VELREYIIINYPSGKAACRSGHLAVHLLVSSELRTIHGKSLPVACGDGTYALLQTHVLGSFVEAKLDEFFKVFAERSIQLWRVVLRYKEQRSHRVQVRVGRLAFSQLYRRNTETPYVHLIIERIQLLESH